MVWRLSGVLIINDIQEDGIKEIAGVKIRESKQHGSNRRILSEECSRQRLLMVKLQNSARSKRL